VTPTPAYAGAQCLWCAPPGSHSRSACTAWASARPGGLHDWRQVHDGYAPARGVGFLHLPPLRAHLAPPDRRRRRLLRRLPRLDGPRCHDRHRRPAAAGASAGAGVAGPRAAWRSAPRCLRALRRRQSRQLRRPRLVRRNRRRRRLHLRPRGPPAVQRPLGGSRPFVQSTRTAPQPYDEDIALRLIGNI